MGLFGNAGPTSSNLTTNNTTSTSTTDAGSHVLDTSAISQNGNVLQNSGGHITINNSGDATFGDQLTHLADSAFAALAGRPNSAMQPDGKPGSSQGEPAISGKQMLIGGAVAVGILAIVLVLTRGKS